MKLPGTCSSFLVRILFCCMMILLFYVDDLPAKDVHFKSESISPCSEYSNEIKRVWNEQTRAEATAAFLKLKGNYPEKVLQQIMPVMDKLVRDWAQQSQQNCTAFFDRKVVEEKEFQARSGCYDFVFMQIHFISAVLKVADHQTAGNAYKALSNISKEMKSCNACSVVSFNDPPVDQKTGHTRHLAMMHLATTQIESILGYKTQAEQSAEKAFTAAKQAGSKALLASVLVERGKALFENNKYAKSETTFQTAQKLFAAGKEVNGIADAFFWQGRIKEKQGQFIEAMKFYNRALELYPTVPGDTSKKRAEALFNKGSALALIKDFDQAKKLLAESLEIQVTMLGQNDPEIAASRRRIGNIWYMAGKHKKALEAFEKSNEIFMVLYGDDFPAIAENLEHAAMSAYVTGAYEKALQYINRAIEINQNIYSSDHKIVAKNIQTRADLYKMRKQYDKALGDYQKSLEINKVLSGDNHLSAVNIYMKMGDVLLKMERPDKAKKQFATALALQLEANSAEHLITAALYNYLGDTLAVMNDHEGAISNYEKSLRIYLDLNQEKTAGANNCYYDLAYSWRKLGELKKAVELNKKSLAICQEIFGPTHLATADTLMQIGYTLVDLDRCDDALPHLEKALEIYSQKLGLYAEKTANTGKWVAFCLDKL